MNPSPESEGKRETVAADESAMAGESDEVLSDRMQPLGTTMSHRGYTLIGFSFVVFEIFFLTLYTDKYWFEIDLSWLGVPAVLIAIGIAHLLLMFYESDLVCRLVRPLWNGLAPIVYQKWVVVNPYSSSPGIKCGLRHILFSAIDELELTFMGNLCLRSRSLCGPPGDGGGNPADLVLKFPFSVGSYTNQKKLVDLVRHHKPGVTVNKRLDKRLGTPEVKGTAMIQQLGAVFLFFVLLDVGHSTFNYLEMLKSYYKVQASVEDKSPQAKMDAQKEFDRAEQIREHPLPFSWVSTKLLNQGNVASGVYQARSDALWELGRKQEAVESLKKALELQPKTFRINLHLARRLTAMGEVKEAQAQISQAIENHKDTFLPQLYMVAVRLQSNGKASADKTYDLYLAKADEEVFGEEVAPWPPGGSRFLHDIWYKDDLEYVFSRLLNRK